MTKPIDGDLIGYWSGRVTLTFHTPYKNGKVSIGRERVSTYPHIQRVLGALELDDEFAVALLVDQVDLVPGDHDPRHVLGAALVRLN